jgi:hypothetical protein
MEALRFLLPALAGRIMDPVLIEDRDVFVRACLSVKKEFGFHVCR